MKHKVTLLIGLAAIALSAAVAIADEKHEISLLFVQTASEMAADREKLQLRLINVGNQTVYFSDRPERVAGHIHLDKFVNGWSKGDDSFAQNPPNAALSVYEPGGEDNALVVVELFEPVKDGNDLVYTYKLIDGDMPESGGATSLFIDTFGPGGGVGAGFHGVGVGARGPGAAGWAGVAVRNCADGNC
ncbi:hypothetical protein FGK63_08615 [Ruegeria sediminis]|uniref:Uncharacterized protein n=1 Tax=Ruegeria sediminis TaxID=2583820 RepID=A0ABY2WXD6_9RHOB|nr:hypothetical protein [Ruegeria sediminis]TMV07524.1 hypothetical protein FGK63_08615 [Ruegeria sediminis]